MNLLYIGAGCDFSILKADLNINIYFFVDSQPRSEFGKCQNPAFERPKFIKNLKKVLSALGFKKVKRYEFRAICKEVKKYYCDGVILFRSKNYSKFLYYFYSTSYPPEQDNHPLYQFIETCNILFVKGHEPEDNVIKLMNTPITFISSDSICVDPKSKGLFSFLKEESNNVDKWYMLHQDAKLEASSYNEIITTEKFGFDERD
jgi:hypothetical protein